MGTVRIRTIGPVKAVFGRIGEIVRFRTIRPSLYFLQLAATRSQPVDSRIFRSSCPSSATHSIARSLTFLKVFGLGG